MAWRSMLYENFLKSAKNDDPMPAGVAAWKKEMDAKSADGDKLKSFSGGNKVKAKNSSKQKLLACILSAGLLTACVSPEQKAKRDEMVRVRRERREQVREERENRAETREGENEGSELENLQKQIAELTAQIQELEREVGENELDGLRMDTLLNDLNHNADDKLQERIDRLEKIIELNNLDTNVPLESEIVY